MALWPINYRVSAGSEMGVEVAGSVSHGTNVSALSTIEIQTFAYPKDFTDVTQFTLTGHVNAIVADTADTYTDADLYNVWVPMSIVARPEVVYLTTTGVPRILRIRPVPCRIDTGVLKLVGGVPDEGVRLVAKTPVLGLGFEQLLYDVKFGKSTINGVEVDFADMNFTFAAPTSDTTVDLATVPRAE